MDFGVIFLDLIFTAFFYLLVPIIFCIRKKPMTKKQINRVIWINGAIFWLIFRIISIAINGEPGTGAAVFLWSGIGKMIMDRALLKDTEAEDLTYECQFCGYQQKVDFELCPRCGKNINQYAHINTEESQKTNHNSSEIEIPKKEPVSQEKRKYCSQCGGLINCQTKVCETCGKQYFKGFSSRIIVIAILAILLIISVVMSLILYIQNTKLNDRIEELEIENQQYYDYWVESFEQIAFFDEFVVFVENDGTNLYHKYECRRFTGNDFWALNIDAAIIDGYEPCPFCCE